MEYDCIVGGDCKVVRRLSKKESDQDSTISGNGLENS